MAGFWDFRAQVEAARRRTIAGAGVREVVGSRRPLTLPARIRSLSMRRALEFFVTEWRGELSDEGSSFMELASDVEGQPVRGKCAGLAPLNCRSCSSAIAELGVRIHAGWNCL